MKPLSEEVVQRSRDGSVQIVRRQFSAGYKNYIVEYFIDDDWRPSKNGPWDYLSNARNEFQIAVAT